MMQKTSEVHLLWKGKTSIVTCLGLLFGSCLLAPTNILPLANAQMFRALKGDKKHISGMISSLFGGIVDTLKDSTNLRAEMKAGNDKKGPFFKGSSTAGKEGKVNHYGSRKARGLAGTTAEQQAILINAGGPDYVDPVGDTWVTDENGYYSHGKRYSTNAAISNTDTDSLYQTERYASEMTYNIALLNGKYDVYLHFVEIYTPAFHEGARIFDVFVEGDLVADNLDIYKEAGNEGNKAYVLLTEDVEVNDGSLTLDFISAKQKAKISAIKVRPASTSLVTCQPVAIDFSTSGSGIQLQGGAYVQREWEQAYGLTLYAAGGFGYLPRLFNTSSVGNDPDLGSPNEWCYPPGPGKGEGGKPSGTDPTATIWAMFSLFRRVTSQSLFQMTTLMAALFSLRLRSQYFSEAWVYWTLIMQPRLQL